MEFKYLVAQEKTEQLQKELKGYKNSLKCPDVTSQADGCESPTCNTNNKFCQTDKTEMKDCPSQTNINARDNLMVMRKRKSCSISDSASTSTEQSAIEGFTEIERYKTYQLNITVEELKKCCLFLEEQNPWPTKAELKCIFDNALKEAWTSGSSKFIATPEHQSNKDSKEDYADVTFLKMEIQLPERVEYCYMTPVAKIDKHYPYGKNRQTILKKYRAFRIPHFLNDSELKQLLENIESGNRNSSAIGWRHLPSKAKASKP